MKHFFLILFLILSFSGFTQVVSGLYAGTLTNDSTKKVQNYEIALSEYRDKITGYSYTTFVANNTYYYSIKRIKATRSNNELIIVDDQMLAHNFPEPPAKGVRQTNAVKLNGEDTLRSVAGIWKTNQTKVYYSLSGGMELKRTTDSSASALVGHLKELGIMGPSAANYDTGSASSPKKPGEPRRGKETSHSPTVVPSVPSVLPYTDRKNKIISTLQMEQSDSIELAFYDNGVIDGDSVSVYVNGREVISRTKLTSAAVRTRIALDPDTEETQLMLVAESLGTLPPNTGLIVVRSGEQRFQINFSADMQTNATIIIRKKRQP